MNGIELAKQYFPNATDAEADSILWGRTGFPCFCPEGVTPEKHFRSQLKAYKELVDAGKNVCDLCNSEATTGYLCESCDSALNKIRKENLVK